MIREEKRTVYCPYMKRQVSIADYYLLMGTTTCQIDVSPFFWRCSEEERCASPVCGERDPFIKQETKEECQVEDRGNIVGTSFPAYSFAIERGKIKEFSLAIGDQKQIYLDPLKAAEEGYPDVAAPPTFGAAIDLWGGSGFMEMCSVLGVNPVKVLHGEQEYQYFGDIVAGDVIKAETTVVDFSEKSKMYLVTLETVYTNQKNELVQKCRKVVVELK